jgi:DNA repair protein RadA
MSNQKVEECKEVKVVKKLELTDIKGVGPATAEKLIEIGKTTVEQVAVMRPEELASELNITRKAAKDITNDAKDKALSTAMISRTFGQQKAHIADVVQRIPTGSSAIDNILGGGFRTEAITLMKGEYSSGKTQLCNQAAINCLKYLKRKVIWIEMESATFAPDRLEGMAKAVGLKIDPDDDFIIMPSTGSGTPSTQFLAYERAIQIMEEKKMNVGLFVVDSFNSSFREYFAGREQLPDRSKETARHIGYLDKLASKYNMAVLLTAQVMDIPDQGGQLGERVKTGHAQKAYGGNVLNHWSTFIISLDQMSTTDWEAVLADSPNMPKAKAKFRIVEAGVRDCIGK